MKLTVFLALFLLAGCYQEAGSDSGSGVSVNPIKITTDQSSGG